MMSYTISDLMRNLETSKEIIMEKEVQEMIHVVAEAQDGSGVNNANFSTPADGGSGRMQMYLWTATGNEIYITQPNTIAGPFSATRGGFGTAPDTAGIKGKVVWSDTGVKGSEKLGCKDSQNKAKLKGNIAVVLRGECEFGEKAYYAQKAGAIAVIICGFDDDNVSMGWRCIWRPSEPYLRTMRQNPTCDKIRYFY
jgi:extracellular elastinolytic metalloproteinase